MALGPSLTDANHHDDNCPGNLCQKNTIFMGFDIIEINLVYNFLIETANYIVVDSTVYQCITNMCVSDRGVDMGMGLGYGWGWGYWH